MVANTQVGSSHGYLAIAPILLVILIPVHLLASFVSVSDVQRLLLGSRFPALDAHLVNNQAASEQVQEEHYRDGPVVPQKFAAFILKSKVSW